jgi:hypothetical protein
MKYKNLGKSLQAAFPEIDWDLGRFSRKGKKSMQGWYGGDGGKMKEGQGREEGGRRRDEGGRDEERMKKE